MRIKIIPLLFACSVACCHEVYGQARSAPDNDEVSNGSDEVQANDNAHDWSAGAGIGLTKLYAQLPVSTPRDAYFVYSEKNAGPGFSYGVSIFSGGLESSYPLYDLGSYNQFTALDLHIKFSLSALFTACNKNYRNYNNVFTILTDDLYFGLGFGAIDNDILSIKSLDSTTAKINPESGKPVIKTHSVVPYFPFKAGYDLYITKRIVLNGDFQYNWCLGNYVDGYNMPFSGHRHTAVYTVGSISLRYYITHNHHSRKGTE